MDLNALYTELILEHSQNSRHKRHLDCANCIERGHNPSCGDDITLALKIENGQIEEAAFEGVGCAISQAATSIMIDLIQGKSAEEAQRLAATFISMIKRQITDETELDVLEEAIAFKNIANMPARVKCAVLAWRTLQEAIKSKEQEKKENEKASS